MPSPYPIRATSWRLPGIAFAGAIALLLSVGLLLSVWIGRAAAQQAGSTKIAAGEYRMHERHNGGAFGPQGEEIYNFRETWSLEKLAGMRYRVEGERNFEFPRYERHSNAFSANLSRDMTVSRVEESAKLRWVPDSGPLVCTFLPAQLQCSSGGSDPKHVIKLETKLEKPYGLLWPISPFSFGGVTRQVERDPAQPTIVDFVQIEQPSAANPVLAMVLEGPLRYLGEEQFATGGKTWTAHKFSLKVAMHPQFLIWTSSKGLLLGLSTEHEYSQWQDEGLRLDRFEGPADF